MIVSMFILTYFHNYIFPQLHAVCSYDRNKKILTQKNTYILRQNRIKMYDDMRINDDMTHTSMHSVS
jgi:hypothetical protein